MEEPTAPATGPSAEERAERLTDGADRLAGGRRSILAHPQFLLIAAASLMTSGLAVVVLGWVGAAHSVLVEEQVPYLISGGFLGSALATIGALMLFAHWLTALIRESRQHEAERKQDHIELMSSRRQDHIELMEALAKLTAAVDRQEETTNGSARGAQAERPVRRAPRRQ